jgi:hypothetical protein
MNLLGDPAEFHSDVSSRVSYSNHYHLLVPPLLRGLVVATVEVHSLKRFNS